MNNDNTPLQVVIPETTMRAVKHAAIDANTTARAVVLSALYDAGYPVPVDQIRDMRAPDSIQLPLLNADQIVGRVVDITPQLATQLLATSPGNRKLRKSAIERYAGAMRRGEWMVAQPLMVDTNGQLRDGHHRLSAVIAAGISVPFLVVNGVAEDTYRVLDTGVNRTMNDVVKFGRRQIQEATLIFGIVNSYSVCKPTVHQMEMLCDKPWRAVSEMLEREAPSHRKVFSSAPVRLAAIYWMMKSSTPDGVDYVIRQYRACSVSDFENMSPRVMAFFRQNMSRLSAGGTGFRNELLSRAINAFDYSAAGKAFLMGGQSIHVQTMNKFKSNIPSLFDIHPEGT